MPSGFAGPLPCQPDVHRDLLGEEDSAHAVRAQWAYQPETAHKNRSEMSVDFIHSEKSTGGIAPRR